MGIEHNPGPFYGGAWVLITILARSKEGMGIEQNPDPFLRKGMGIEYNLVQF